MNTYNLISSFQNIHSRIIALNAQSKLRLRLPILQLKPVETMVNTQQIKPVRLPQVLRQTLSLPQCCHLNIVHSPRACSL